MAQQTTCKECGWACQSCDDQGLLLLHVEVENLKQQLLERESHIRIMETSFLAEADKFPNGQAAALTEELLTWQDKYSRLYESYKRVQKVNQSLEDKLLRIVDKCETEKNDLLKEVSALTQRLIDARTKVNRLQSENERYKNDVSLAIQLLQCKPANFVPQKYDSLPADLQQKVLAYVCGRRRPSDVGAVPIRVEMRTIKVPVSTSPPSAMLYPVNESQSAKENNNEEGNDEEVEELISDTDNCYSEGRPPLDNVSAAIMAKVLEERERERQQTRHCESCTCFTHVAAITVDSSTQTSLADFETNTSCLNGYAATTRGSQGHVRFVDSLPRNTSGSTQINFPSRLGLKIGETRNVKCDTPLITIDPLSDSKTNEKSQNSSGIDIKNDAVSKRKEYCHENHLSSGEKKLDCYVCESQIKERDKTNVSSSPCIDTPNNSKCIHEDLIQSGEDLITFSSSPPTNDLTSKIFKEDCVIDLEVSSDGRSDVPKANRGKELLISRNSDVSKSTGVGHTQRTGNAQSFSLKTANREVRNLTGADTTVTTKSPSSWMRYPSDTTKKNTLVVSNDKTVLPSVRSETNVSRVPFPAASLRVGNKGAESPGSGPRFCSMRLQAGTSNILLDNATSYEPVLYTSRHTQDGVESWGVSASRSGAAVLVHAPRSRAPSLDEPPQQNKVALWVHANTTQTGT